jgi:hypothetical protein
MINNMLDFLITLKKFLGKCLKSLKHKICIFILKAIKDQSKDLNREMQNLRYENPVKSLSSKNFLF